jgi:hypothetical protein
MVSMLCAFRIRLISGFDDLAVLRWAAANERTRFLEPDD